MKNLKKGQVVKYKQPKKMAATHCTSCGAPYTTHSGNCEYCGTIAPGSAAVVIDPLKESEAMRIARALYGGS